jgi:hypothetical protein
MHEGFSSSVQKPSNYILAQFNGTLVVNICCFLLHLFWPAPSAGQATRGYLLGGLLTDFVGQLGPSSRTRLCALDLFIVLLELLVLSISQARSHLAQFASANPSIHHAQSEDAGRNEDVDIEAGLPTQTPMDLFKLNRHYGSEESAWSGQGTVADLWIIDIAEQQLLQTRQRNAQRSAGISQMLRVDLRRRRYELNLPFRT